MKYKNAQDILPDRLLKELQKYVSGETIYVPNAQGKKQWGETSGARSYYKQRNEQIRQAFRTGSTIEDLARQYNLSTDSIRKIVN
jgi:Mor family transcriptional regulator